jgi:hypothetical protein
MIKSSKFLSLYQKHLCAQSEEWQNVDQKLLESFQLSTISKEQYEEEQKLAQKHCFELGLKEILLTHNLRKFQTELVGHKEPSWPETIAYLISKAIFYKRIRRIDPEERENSRLNDPTHKAWTKLTRKFYNSYSPEDDSEVWCPITQRYCGASFEMKIPHIIPPNLGYETCNIYSDSRDRACRFCGRREMEFPCSFALKERFNEDRQTLIGHQQSGCNPTEYSVVVLDGSMLGEPTGYGKRTFDINHQRLTFENDRRPNPKFVYWHYAAVDALVLLLDFDLNCLSPRLNSNHSRHHQRHPFPYG